MNAKPKRDLLRRKQGNICCYCGVRLVPAGQSGHMSPPNSETLEHLRRKADGGTNHPDNLALSCRECNIGRGSLDWLTYKTIRSGHNSYLA